MLDGRVILLLTTLLMLACPAAAQKRVALVVGNSNYVALSKLKNPTNDAQLMARTLSSLGFTLVDGGPLLNLSKQSLEGAVQRFREAAEDAEIAFFFFAGHGLAERNTNYLAPADAKVRKTADFALQLFSSDILLNQLEASKARLKIVVLDACRNNPFEGSDFESDFRSFRGGLAEMKAPVSTVIAFSTQPGAVAADGSGNNSPYTKALAETITKPGLSVFDVFNSAAVAVMEENKAQQPWMTISPLKGKFSFVAPDSVLPPTGQRPHIVIRPQAPENSLSVEGVQQLLEDAKKLMARNDHFGAREPLARAIKMNPKSALAHSFRGYTYLLEGDELRARAGNNKALLESAIKTYALAFPDLDKAIELDPAYAPARRHRGMVVMGIYQARKAQGQAGVLERLSARAIADFRKAVELDPLSKTSLNALGEAYVAGGEYREAIKQFDQATALDSTYAAPYQGRCEAYRGLGQIDRAYAEGRKSEARDNRPEARRCVASLLVARGR
jgi:tetratricopeptide (TPR) repeat protein